MPDWMSHLLIGLIVTELFNIRKKSLVLLGALMPDLISKSLLLSLYFGFLNNLSLESFHTPLMCFLLAILIAPLFKYDRLKTIFLMSVGLAIHFLSDLTMRHFSGGIRLFFPFSMNVYNIDLIWPEKSIYVLVVSLLIYIFVKLVKKFNFDRLKD